MRVIFIARTFPPTIGGIENQNEALSRYLSSKCSLKLIANKRNKLFLPIFIPYAVLVSLINIRKTDIIILGDGVCAIAGWALKLFSKKPVLCVIHGLDVTWNNRIYQFFWLNGFFKKIDKFIAVSQSTQSIAINYGLDESKINVILNGTEESNEITYDRQYLENQFSLKLKDKFVLLTVSRLIKRKGIAWFIDNVMPELPENSIYIIAGNGPESETINKTIIKKGLEHRVYTLGHINNETKQTLFKISDLYIQPNVPVSGDVEGFGITMLEAGITGLPSVASKMEGIKDAVKNGINGWLVNTLDQQEFCRIIIDKLEMNVSEIKEIRSKTREYCLSNCHWDSISDEYMSLLTQINLNAEHRPGFSPTTNRINKAKKILKVVSNEMNIDSGRLRILDIGTGNGEIASFIGKNHDVVSVDVRDYRSTRDGYKFCISAEELPFRDSIFDIVISNHVIEHVDNQRQHAIELMRVVKQSGVIYLATPNRIWPYEVHYKLPVIHYLPHKTFIKLLKFIGRYKEEIKLLTYRNIKSLFIDSSTKIYSTHIIKEPDKYFICAPDFATWLLKHTPFYLIHGLFRFHPTIIMTIKKI